MDRYALSSRSYLIPGHAKVFLPFPVMDPLTMKSKLHVAERKTKGAFVQEDVAYTMVIPFVGKHDNDRRLSQLAVTFASGASREYNMGYPLLSRHDVRWPEQRRNFQLIITSIGFTKLIESKDWTECKQWYDLWEEFNELKPRQNLLLHKDWVMSRSGELVLSDVTSTYHGMGRAPRRSDVNDP